MMAVGAVYECYIQDPKTGRFLGRRPGCKNEASEKLLKKVNKGKDVYNTKA